MTDPPAPFAQALAAKYRIVQQLGAGGMATVYLAEDLKHRREVAIKLLRPELGQLGPDRFLREVETIARLSHPHLLPLHDSGEAGGLLYYVMPYVQGPSLRTRIEQEKQLPVDEAVGLIRKVAHALAYAHDRGVIHRDIKPENILLHEGEPVVADFGIALGTGDDTRLTERGLAIGTPAYMSPEQMLGDRELDGRSDVYSLACVLYELLAGEPPCTGPTAQVIMAKRLMDPVPSVRRLRPTVPAGIDRVLQQALAAAPADRFASATAFADALAAPGPDSRAPVVAVLPFRNLSPDPENEFFADGITEDVITHLSKARTLDVISRASVMPFKNRQQTVQEIGAALHAGTLLDGSVRRAGNRVRIVAQLVDARTGQHLWAESYDRELTDIFEIQTDVALHIAAALRAELSPEEQVRIRHEPTSDIEAYQLYVQGRHCALRASREGLFQAVDYFEQATKADPGYAQAWAGIALALVELGETGFLSSEAGYPKAKEAVLTALRLDPRLADGHCALAQLKAVWEFDWIGAEAAFKRALALQPGYAPAYDLYGRLCTDLQRYEEALALQRRARELDPLSNRADMATALLRAGRYQEAEAAAAAMERVDPGYARLHATLGWARFKAGRMAEGIAGLERAVALAPDGVQWLAQLGQALALAGQPERARQILARLDAMAAETYVSPYHRAHVYTGLGEFDTAMDLLEQAVQERSAGIHGIKGSFLFAPLRDHPRFVALLRRMNLA